MVTAAIPFGLTIGIALGMLGGGGSVLAVPVLVYVLGQSVHQATTASLVVVTAGALAGGLAHARESHVCLIVPTLTVFLALSMRLAIGTSLAIITATSAPALTTHLLAGRGLDIPVTAT